VQVQKSESDLRIFIALDIDDAIRACISSFLDGVRNFAPDAGWARPESLHVTLKFIGEKPPESVEEVKRALTHIRSAPFELAFRGYGFFPTPKAARVFWIGIESGPPLAHLATAVEAATASLGIPKEGHNFSPHLTLARRRGSSGAPRREKNDAPDQDFQRLQQKLAAMPAPDVGTMTAREFFLYQSQLSRSGARYSKLERFALCEDDPPSPGRHNP
jgi:2'-5' RNA ligase